MRNMYTTKFWLIHRFLYGVYGRLLNLRIIKTIVFDDKDKFSNTRVLVYL